MIVYEITDDRDRLVAFQIPMLGKRRLRKVIKRAGRALNGTHTVTLRKNSDPQKRDLEFCVDATNFEAIEMWDGSNRYWIGPVVFGSSVELDAIADAFKRVSARAWF